MVITITFIPSVSPGNRRRQKSDMIRHVLQFMSVGWAWAGLPCEEEVLVFYCRLIPQAGLSMIGRPRDRQGMDPDFRILLVIEVETIHELNK